MSARDRSLPSTSLTVGLIVVVGVVITALLAPHAIPIYQHDWAWPLDRMQGKFLSANAISIWNDAGFGSAAGAPNAWLEAWLVGTASYVLGPYPTLVLFIATVIGGSLAGTYALLRAFETGRPGALLGASIYASSPVLLNKLHAGHTYFLIGYAFVPLACWCIARRWDRGPALGIICSALALAVAAGQFQMLAFGAIAVAAISLAKHGRSGVAPAFAAIAVAMLLHIPDYAVMFSARTNVSFFPTLPTTYFEESLSVPLYDAFAQFRYFAGYAARGQMGGTELWTTVVVVATAIAIVAACGAVIRAKAGRSVLSAGIVLFALGSVFTAGFDGPLRAIEEAVFSATPFATAFREFYNFSVWTSLGLAIVVARSVSGYGVALVRYLPAATIAIAYVATIALNPLSANRKDDSIIAKYIVRQQSRVLYAPGAPNLSIGDAPSGGLDPIYGNADSAPVTYGADPTRAAYWYTRGRPYIERISSRFAWSAESSRPLLHDNYLRTLDEPTRKLIAGLHYKGSADRVGIRRFARSNAPRDVRIAVRSIMAVPTWAALVRLRPTEHIVTPSELAPPTLAAHPIGVDPFSSYVQSERWLPALPNVACLPMSSYFFVGSGAYANDGCAWRYERVGKTSCLVLDEGGLHARGPCTPFVDFEQLRRELARPNVRVFYIAEAFDRRWRLRCDGAEVAPNVMVDAYAAGWIATRCDRDAAIFTPDRTFRTRIAYVGIGLVLLLAAAFRPLGEKKEAA